MRCMVIFIINYITKGSWCKDIPFMSDTKTEPQITALATEVCMNYFNCDDNMMKATICRTY
jgi:hypothetical protein